MAYQPLMPNGAHASIPNKLYPSTCQGYIVPDNPFAAPYRALFYFNPDYAVGLLIKIIRTNEACWLGLSYANVVLMNYKLSSLGISSKISPSISS